MFEKELGQCTLGRESSNFYPYCMTLCVNNSECILVFSRCYGNISLKDIVIIILTLWDLISVRHVDTVFLFSAVSASENFWSPFEAALYKCAHYITLHSGSWLKCCMVGSLTSSFTHMLYSLLLDTLQLKIFILIRTCWLLVCCWLPVKIHEFYALLKYFMIDNKRKYVVSIWWRGTVVERRSLAGELSLSCARPAADGWPLMWVSHPL